MNFKDCICSFDGQNLQLENDLIRALLFLRDGALFCETVVNKQSGYEWKNTNGTTFFSIPNFPFSQSSVSFSAKVTDNDGLSEPYLLSRLAFSTSGATVCLNLSIFPSLPFIRSEITLDGIFGGAVSSKREATSDGNENRKKLGSRAGKTLLQG